MPYLSVIIPAYNEAKNFNSGSLDEVITYLKSQPFDWEVILVNDGSTDNTLELVTDFSSKNPHVKVINNPHMGKAASIITGAAEANGSIVLFSDMDQATPISEFSKFETEFQNGAGIVIGSRSDRKGAPFYRQILAYGQMLMRFLILRLPFKDTQCGFKAFTNQVAKSLFSKMGDLHPLKLVTGPAVNPGFDLELLYLGRKMGLKIVEVPVAWEYKESKRVDFLHGAISGLHELFLVRLRSLTNAYKI